MVRTDNHTELQLDNEITCNSTQPHGTENSFLDPFIIWSSLLAVSILTLIIWTLAKHHKIIEWTKQKKTNLRSTYEKWRVVLPFVFPPNTWRTRIVLFLCAFTMVLIRLLKVYIPLTNKWIMDALSDSQSSECYKFILFNGGLTFIKSDILNRAEHLLWCDLKRQSKRKIYEHVFRHIHRLSLRWHLDKGSGEVHSIMERGVRSMPDSLRNIFGTFLPVILDIIIALVYCYTNFGFYSLAVVSASLMTFFVATRSLYNWQIECTKKENDFHDKFRTVVLDSLINFETVKHFNNDQFETANFQDAYGNVQNAQAKDNFVWQIFSFAQDSVIKIASLAGSLCASYLILQDGSQYTVGDYALFTTYIMNLFWPINSLIWHSQQIHRDFVGMEKMVELLNTDVEIHDSPDAVELEAESGPIEFHNVCFHHKEDSPILQDVSFRAEAGQTLAIVGPSGSGKTTITRLIYRLYDVVSGRITVNGRDITQIKMESLRKQIGIVPQECALFNQTIGYNIKYGRPESDNMNDIVEAAKAAAIHNFVETQKEGYETMVGERGLKLSGGERQRMAIARATLKRPHYIVLDEATSALDTTTEREIQANLLELCQARTCVVIAHRLSTIMHAHKIVVLNSEGRVAEQGSHKELLAREGLYAEMWNIQLQNYE